MAKTLLLSCCCVFPKKCYTMTEEKAEINYFLTLFLFSHSDVIYWFITCVLNFFGGELDFFLGCTVCDWLLLRLMIGFVWLGISLILIIFIDFSRDLHGKVDNLVSSNQDHQITQKNLLPNTNSPKIQTNFNYKFVFRHFPCKHEKIFLAKFEFFIRKNFWK